MRALAITGIVLSFVLGVVIAAPPPPGGIERVDDCGDCNGYGGTSGKCGQCAGTIKLKIGCTQCCLNDSCNQKDGPGAPQRATDPASEHATFIK